MSRPRTVADGWVPTSHGSSAYNRGCRCDECRKAHRIRIRKSGSVMKWQRANYARRVMLGGRWFAPDREGRHGEWATYSAYGCRCLPCTRAQSEYKRGLREAAS